MPATGITPTEFIQAFARALRYAGVRTGTAELADAVTALGFIDLARRADVRETLACILLRRHGDREAFDRVFDHFFASPDSLRRSPPGEPTPAPRSRSPGAGGDADGRRGEAGDPVLAASLAEAFRQRDFESMSEDELRAARALLQDELPLLRPVPTRRFRAHARGRAVDLRRTVHAARRTGGEVVRIVRRRRGRQPPGIVMLIDISGSMAAYSRMFLYFAHTLTRRYGSVATLLFGTRLTNVSRQLRDTDPDRAFADLGRLVRDWDGGTRISASLHAFNRDWGRRLLSRRTVVLLLTDGLERDPGASLAAEMRRLRLTSSRLVWLNPLLRYAEFEPAARGIRLMLPYVDEFVPAHNVASLAGLAALLGAAGSHRRRRAA